MRSAPVVLIVEDDPVLQDALRSGLERAQFEVHTAFDCRKALLQLEGPAPDVVCIDLCLPDRSGYELCELVRQTPGCADVPILVTGDAGFPEHMVHAEMAGANAFLKKPFRIEALVRCIESLLDRAPASFTSAHVLRMPESGTLIAPSGSVARVLVPAANPPDPRGAKWLVSARPSQS